ncbi:DISARM system SNF2-like helicase DrmD [Haliangium sp.]|uniref:DISARM system SNF2-like helicase DrmD n=1 Tax=Haliangium sp. TaxID=2663208 RepID=UPI003D13C859
MTQRALPHAATGHPREGMMAIVRNRRAVIARVKPMATQDGQLHLVELEYTDLDGGQPDDTVIWERELGARVIEPGALPDVAAEPPMPGVEHDALLRACRWSALTPFLAPDRLAPQPALPVAAPFHGAVEVEDFQLVPLLQALEMPRISLLLADDVGLGKTIEAGLILTELLLRRRIRRVLIMTPASLRDQWQQEMLDKFSLGFDIVDRAETHALQRRLGLDANPWRTFPRIITSYHYLRQRDVFESFRAASRSHEAAAQLPWDLLIVDEAHNLMPASFGDDSELARMLRELSPLFEHKLFLTATPHNGHTRSFSGLLELLDPVRFHRTAEFTDAERARVEQVVVRRLKREINAADDEASRPRRFAERQLDPLELRFGPGERALSAAFADFRAAVKQAVRAGGPSDVQAGAFAVEVLQKRLLSAPVTLADSWHRTLDGLSDEPAPDRELITARRTSEEDIDDDRERQDRGRFAARTVGAWLRPLASKLESEITAVTRALDQLGLTRPTSADGGDGPGDGEHDPRATRTDPAEPVPEPSEDARFDRLCQLIDDRLRHGRGRNRRWRDDERLIVFTEYKTTLDYLAARLRARYPQPSAGRDSADPDPDAAVRVLYGGMDPQLRRAVKRAFNDPQDPVRVLVATDAASEGLNLQETARLLLHYEIPWNPSRLEQRNGRLDRHGQGRDVTVFHFTSHDDADIRFLGRVVDKVHRIREDLGTVGEVFDAAFQRRFADLEDVDRVDQALDLAIDSESQARAVPHTRTDVDLTQLHDLRRHLDLGPDTLRDTLDVALGLDLGRPRLDGPDGRGRFRLRQPVPGHWRALIDDHLRLPDSAAGQAGALPGLIFDPALFMVDIGARSVFRPSRDTTLLHLGHPLFRQALAAFARLRFPGAGDRLSASRWCVRRGPMSELPGVPADADALILLSVEELAVNSLREPFHHWVRTLRLPVVAGELVPAASHQPPDADRDPAAQPGGDPVAEPVSAADLALARTLWNDLAVDLRARVRDHAARVEEHIRAGLDQRRDHALAEAADRFTGRIKEVRAAMKRHSLSKLEREIRGLEKRHANLTLFPDMERDVAQRLRDLQDELARRVNHSEQLLALLEQEKERVLQRLLPARHSLRDGGVQVFPLTVEIRLPAGSDRGRPASGEGKR